MKKLIIIYALLVVAIVAFAIFQRGNLANIFSFGPQAQATVNGKTLNLILVKSEKDKEKGLSGRNSLNKNSGMLFIFDKKETPSFWMREMKFPIDIIFIDDTKIVTIAANAQAPADPHRTVGLQIYRPSTPVNYVLEVNAGKAQELGIKEGDTVTFTNLK